MTENLVLPLTAGTMVEASYNTTATAYSFTPTSCASSGACSMNANTVYDSSTSTYYYSWYAATAETGTSTDVSIDTSASICPIGWRLPAGYIIDSAKSYGSLTNAYGFTTNGDRIKADNTAELESAPLNFARYGFYGSGHLQIRSDIYAGFYWSSTASTDSARAYNFLYDTSAAYPQSETYKNSGYPVRCLAI